MFKDRDEDGPDCVSFVALSGRRSLTIDSFRLLLGLLGDLGDWGALSLLFSNVVFGLDFALGFCC